MSDAWQPPETAPKDGKPFLITVAGPEMDLCTWVPERGEFQDYYFKQSIAPQWPYMIGWKPIGRPAAIGDTDAETRQANGWDRPAPPPPPEDRDNVFHPGIGWRGWLLLLSGIALTAGALISLMGRQ